MRKLERRKTYDYGIHLLLCVSRFKRRVTHTDCFPFLICFGILEMRVAHNDDIHLVLHVGRLERRVTHLEEEKTRLERLLREKDAAGGRLAAKHRKARAELEPIVRQLQELQIKHRSRVVRRVSAAFARISYMLRYLSGGQVSEIFLEQGIAATKEACKSSCEICWSVSPSWCFLRMKRLASVLT